MIMMETLKPVHPRGGWQEDEINVLFEAVKTAAGNGQPLRDVFADVAQELKRKPNSIRNFYYARLREMPNLGARNAPFRTFTQEELHNLLRTVLIARGNGESVRACVTRMAQGDRGLMLRYQNKYRSILKNHPDLLEAVAVELRKDGLPCPAQVTGYRRLSSETGDMGEVFEEALALSKELDDDCLPLVLLRICELYQRLRNAEARAENIVAPSTPGALEPPMPQKSSADLEITLTDLRGEDMEEGPESSEETAYYSHWMDTRREVDRLRVQVDLLKLHLEDTENQHQADLKLLRDTVHDFLSLPQARQVEEIGNFVHRAGEALRALDFQEELG
jgi:hypothetical protein